VAMQIKWIAFRFGLIEPWMWTNLARSLQFAEHYVAADTTAALYLSDVVQTSANQEFLRAAMLAASSMESLSPLEQEIVDRCIQHFAGTFTLDRRAGDAVNFYFDLNHALPPRRALETPAKAAHRRYFGALDALPPMQACLESMPRVGVAAVPFTLPKGSEPRQVTKVLEHLALHWGKQQPARAWDRRLTTTCIEIKHDYRAVRQILEDSERGMKDAGDAERPEYWIVDNAGRGGYSAIVPKGQRGWLRLGVLIAVRLEYRDVWSVAVIRRVETDEHHQRKVGIRLISRKPVTALMRAAKRTGKTNKFDPGILLNTKPSSNGGVHLLLRPSTFAPQDDIEVCFGADQQQSLLLTPTQVMDATLDYEWVRYEVKR
jgi:hypothetical protein